MGNKPIIPQDNDNFVNAIIIINLLQKDLKPEHLDIVDKANTNTYFITIEPIEEKYILDNISEQISMFRQRFQGGKICHAIIYSNKKSFHVASQVERYLDSL